MFDAVFSNNGSDGATTITYTAIEDLTIDAGQFVALVGSSGAGKTTLVDALMQARPELERVISCTTRPRRDSDPRGEYAYFSNEEFDKHLEGDEFLWWGEYASQRYGTLKISVSDDGTGIDPADAEKIFEPFFTRPSPDGTTGAGIGLAIARRAIELHGGSISAQNIANSGLLIEIEL